MKKNLRLLCLGLAAATITCGFAQEDKTSLLKNADMEQGVKGWSFDGTDVVGKDTKNPSVKIGFHGMSNGVQEAWHSNVSNPLGDSYVMQRLSNLPSGTYVFGAYAAAAKQHNRNDVCERNAEGGHILIENAKGEKVHQYSDWWSNRDSIYGVVLFANDDTVRVATDNPDLSERGEFWGHSSKFNVAVTLTDEDVRKGYLDVGMRVSSTNANYIVWDNATLYYFDNMSEAEALDAMAEIDMTKAAEIADTLTKDYVMQKDTLVNLKAAIAAAAAKTSTAATLWDDSEELFINAGLARRSITDYANLKKNVETATKVLGYEVMYTADYLPMLEEALEEAQAAYDAAELDRKGLTELRNGLNYYVAAVKFDSVYVASDDLFAFMEEVKNLEGQPGGYSAQQYATLDVLYEELLDTMAYFEENWGLPYEEDLFNPNNLWPYVARVYATIQNVKDNPMTSDFTKMPVVIPAGEDGRVEGTTLVASGAYNGLYEYTSQLFTFAEPVENLKITVKKSANGGSFFSLSKLAFYDADGELIELTEDNVSSEYDHNKINGEGNDGQGVPGMLDDDAATYFHSAWANSPAGYHSLDIVLPDGGYTAFSFQMISRKGQPHQFPGEIEVSTPMPNRASLETLLARAKAYNAYSNGEVGFYAKDFSYLTDLVIEIETALEGYPSEEDCKKYENRLRTAIAQFDADMDKAVNLPVPGKEYHIVSGLPGFYEKQFVEKAITVHTDTVKSLWWESAAADSLNQKFVFDPILVDDEHYIYNETKNNADGTTTVIPYYAYTVKNVATGLYIDSAFINNNIRLASEATDTVFLKPLGRGQWNIIVRDEVFHAGDHYSGSYSEAKGNYGGTYGVGSAIVAWGEGIDSPSSWFIREMPELPLTQLVAAGEYKSECFHFAPANTITLTAEGCAFENLALYDLYGQAIAIDTIVVDGGKATITTPNNIVGCAFGFNNKEGVASVEFNAFVYNPAIEALQAAYDAAVAVAPVEGNDVMQYADITAYTAAIAEAEAMLETGASDAEIEAMVKKLEDVVAALVPNMPEAGKYYYIYSALDKFELNHGYRMALYTKESMLNWAQENDCEWNRYWQFEPATEGELKAVLGEKYDASVKAYYIKSVATGEYIGKADGQSTHIPMTSEKGETVPYTITSLKEGNAVAIAGVNNAGHRLHGAGHGEGANKAGTVVYWNSGLGTASMWAISEAQYDATDIDFSEIEPETAVVKGTFDLFGRRVVAPTAPGIYIIDGRKKLVK